MTSIQFQYLDSNQNATMKYLIYSLSILLSFTLSAQDTDRKIQFPDVEGYQTLICDFHIHTVFSDGHVWPTIRVEEAVKDGLDAIALTEHIEYQPWKADMNHEDRNRSYEIARQRAKPHDLIVIHGTEITRGMPPGHANALFVKDVNEIMVEDSLESYRIARSQGAFIFWNHPHWIVQQKDALPKLSDFHKKLIDEDLLHGLEVVNDLTFSEEGLGVANRNDLVVMGTSDIHGLVDYQYRIDEGGHRPVSLVLAKERTEESIKEALFSGRTITWYEDILAGKADNMNLLLDASLTFKNKGYIGDSKVLSIEITNHSDARFVLNNTSIYEFYSDTDVVVIEPHSTKKMEVITSRADVEADLLTFDVLNAKVDYKKTAEIEFSLE